MPVIREFYLAVGWLSVAVGFIGIFLPILPTTPFLILAAACFSRGSPRLHNWLLQHRYFGPPLYDWENGGAIRPRVKVTATALMWMGIGFAMLVRPFPWVLRVIAIAVGLGVTIFILSRPSTPRPPFTLPLSPSTSKT